MIKNRKSLIDIEKGVTTTVAEMLSSMEMKARLMSIGLVEGTRIVPIYESPSGGLKAYEFRGCVFAIRNEDAKNIIVEAC